MPSSKSKGKVGLLIALVIIIVFGAITFFNYWRFRNIKAEKVERSEIVPVETAVVQMMALKNILKLTGDIRPLKEVYVTPKIPGKIIEKIFVEKGDGVRKGDLIATLEKDTIKAQIEQAKTQLASARARLKEVEANLVLVRKDRQRLENLFKKKAISQQKLDQVRAKYTAMLASKQLAQSQIETARASLHLLEILLKDHEVRSPIAGHVSARYVDAGNMSNTSKPIVRISREDVVKIVTTVTEKDYPLIKKGMNAQVFVDAFPGKSFEGTVTVVNPTLDPGTRSAQIEIRIHNKALALRSGMFAHILLSLGQRQALVVPREALNRLPGTGSYYVFCAEGGKAVLKNISVGEIQGNYAEVTEGLKEGEGVIIRGQNRVKDGSPIKVVTQWQGAEEG